MEGTVGLLPQPVRPGWRRRTETGTSTHTIFFRETLPIVRNLGLTEEKNRNIKSIIRTIKCYVDGLVNETVERRNFRKHMCCPGPRVTLSTRPEADNTRSTTTPINAPARLSYNRHACVQMHNYNKHINTCP